MHDQKAIIELRKLISQIESKELQDKFRNWIFNHVHLVEKNIDISQNNFVSLYRHRPELLLQEIAKELILESSLLPFLTATTEYKGSIYYTFQMGFIKND